MSNWIDSLANFERTGAFVYDEEHLDLGRLRRFCEEYGLDLGKLKFVHVAGSKGKGTTCRFIAEYLWRSGLKVGLFTSPHLLSLYERIWCCGREISEAEFGVYASKLEAVAGEDRAKSRSIQKGFDRSENPLSFFEVLLVIALEYFIDQGVEYCVLEVGLGGRLDATNIVRPELSVITTVELEHTAILGDTLEEVMGEKLGIVKDGVPVLVGYQSEEGERICRRRLEGREGVYYVRAAVDLQQKDGAKWKNGQVAYNALEILFGKVDIELFRAVFEDGGKIFERIVDGKRVVFDVAHTVNSFANLLDYLGDVDAVFVLGMLKDKKIEEMLAMIEGRVYLTVAHEVRGERAYGGREVIEDPVEAFRRALGELKRDQVLVVAGSHFLVAKIFSTL